MSGDDQRFTIASELIPEDAPRRHVVKRNERPTIYYAGNPRQWKLEQHSMGLCSVVEVLMRRGEEPRCTFTRTSTSRTSCSRATPPSTSVRTSSSYRLTTRPSCRAASRTPSR